MLGGRLDDIRRYRGYLIGDVKLSFDEEKKHARKFMTPEIEEYLDEKKTNIGSDKANAILNSLFGSEVN